MLESAVRRIRAAMTRVVSAGPVAQMILLWAGGKVRCRGAEQIHVADMALPGLLGAGLRARCLRDLSTAEAGFAGYEWSRRLCAGLITVAAPATGC